MREIFYLFLIQIYLKEKELQVLGILLLIAQSLDKLIEDFYNKDMSLF